nr:hypothetical protein [Burkholderia ambifaria]
MKIMSPPKRQFHSHVRHETAARKKAMLLQLPTAYVNEVSLVSHIALAAFVAGKGNRHLMYRLIRATYLSYLLWQEGIGGTEHRKYRAAESALEQAAGDADTSGRWFLNEESAETIAHILRSLDEQFNRVPAGIFEKCDRKLEHLLRVVIPQRGEALFEKEANAAEDRRTAIDSVFRTPVHTTNSSS